MLLAALTACVDPNAGATGITFVLAPTDLGEPRAAATGFDPAAGDALGLALDHGSPVFANPAPFWETPLEVWAILLREDVSTPGTCPDEIIDGGATVHAGDCRTSYGYEIDGDVTERAWDADGASWERYDFDVEVVGDVDEPVFDRVAMHGSVVKGVPDDGSLTAHYDVNLTMEVTGYWDERPGEEATATAWSSWAVAGTAEDADGAWALDLALDIGGSGGLTLSSQAVAEKDTCPIELDGEATLAEGVTAAFTAGSCDACADVTWEGGSGTACAPD